MGRTFLMIGLCAAGVGAALTSEHWPLAVQKAAYPLFAAPVSTQSIAQTVSGWSSVGPGGGGWLTDIAFLPSNPRIQFAALDCGGVRKTENNGATWSIPSKGIEPFYGTSIESVAFHPVDPNLVLLASWRGVYRSTDGGATWKLVFSVGLGEWLRVNTVAFDTDAPNRVYAGSGSSRSSITFDTAEGFTGDEGTVWISEDAGAHWDVLARFDRGMSIYRILVDGKKTVKRSDDWIGLATNKGFYYSDNGGKSFEKRDEDEAGLPKKHFREAVMDPLVRTRLWFAIPYFGVFRSEDRGLHWKNIGPFAEHGFMYLRMDPNTDGKHPATLLVSSLDWYGGVGGVWETHTADAPIPEWKKIYPPALKKISPLGWNTHEGLSAGATQVGYPDGVRTIAVVAPAARLFSSTDDGATWKSMQTAPGQLPGTWRGNGFELMIPAAGAVDPTDSARIYVSYIDMGTFRSDDRGGSWKQLEAVGGHWAGGNAESIAVNPVSQEVLIGLETGTSHRSRNFGETWNKILETKTYEFAFRGLKGVGYAATPKGLYWSRDGKTWSQVQELSREVLGIQATGDQIYALAADGVYFQVGTRPWRKLFSVTRPYPRGLMVNPAWHHHMILSTERGVSVSVNGGAQWTLALEKQAEAISGAGFILYAKTRTDGIFRSVDGGHTWSNVTGLAPRDGFEGGLFIDPKNPNRVWYGTQCMGLWHRNFSSL